MKLIFFMIFLAMAKSLVFGQNLCSSSFRFRYGKKSAANIIVNSIVEPYHLLYDSSGFTWEVWIKLNSSIINQSVIISTEDQVPFQDIFLGFGLGNTSNALSFLVRDDGTSNSSVVVESVQNLTIGIWYHIAAVCDYNNSLLSLYKNGLRIQTIRIPSSITSHRLIADRQVQIGNASRWARNNIRDYGINADVDEVRFWKGTRTTQQILNNMSSCFPETLNLVAFFKADERTGSISSSLNSNYTAILDSTLWEVGVPGIICPIDTTSRNSSVCNNQLPYNWYGQSITQAGTYFHSLTNRWGCDSVIRLNVTINPSYKDSTTITICQGDTLWGQSTTGYYTRHFQTILGCDSSVTVHLWVKPVIVTSETATICQGGNLYGHTETGIYTDTISPCTYRRLTLTVIQPHTDTLIRTICRGENLFGHTNPGKYLDTIGLCQYRFLNLSVNDKPVRHMPVDMDICEGSISYLDAGQYPYIKWHDGSTSSSYKVSKSGRYSVTVGNRCDTVTFFCTVSIKQCSLKIPNAFSPNGDGLNDKWIITALEVATNCKVLIYNRWGQMIFNSVGYNEPWDGKMNGNPLPTGAYYYIITIKNDNYSGSVTLLR